jgi:hypothetical protein
VPSNAVDGNVDTYWESTDSDFPQWFELNMQDPVSIGQITIALPPLSSWPSRTQTIEIQASTDGSTWTTIEPSTVYSFTAPTPNSVTITFPATTAQYLLLTFTANSAWPAGQISELDVYAAS